VSEQTWFRFTLQRLVRQSMSQASPPPKTQSYRYCQSDGPACVANRPDSLRVISRDRQ